MSALLEKMNSLPKSTTAILGDDDAGAPEGNEDNNTDKPANGDDVGNEEEADEPVDKRTKAAPSSEADEDKEPPKTAPKAEKDAYKQRKLKQADEEKAAAKADAERLKQELEEARKEKEEWKKQAQRTDRPPATQATPVEKKDPAAEMAKDPVAFLAKGLDEANKRINSFENEKTTNAASAELAEMETKYKTEKATDYDDVMKHAEDAEVAKMQIANPKLTEASIRKAFKDDKLKAAVMFLVQGRDPVEGLYQLAKTGYGYQPKTTPADTKTEKSEAEKKRFDAVNKNKNKSATGLSAGGHTGAVEVRGPETTKKRTLRDFASLTKEQKDADYIAE